MKCGPTLRCIARGCLLLAPWAAVLPAAVVCLAGGCRRVTPAPVKPTAEQLWEQGQACLADGDVERAAALLTRSLRMTDDTHRRRDLAVRLTAAGRADLAAGLLAGRTERQLVSLADALKAFRESPPPGYEANPYVVGGMGDALHVLETPVVMTATAEPMRLTARNLAIMAHHWEKWQELGSEGGDSEPRPGRAMVLWVLDCPPVRAAGLGPYVVHTVGAEGRTFSLAHLGSWPMGTAEGGFDAVALADKALGCPAWLRFAAWRGPGHPAELVLAGQLDGDGFVVTAGSDPPAYRALLALLADDTISPGRVTSRDAAEQEDILGLVDRLGMTHRLVREGPSLVVPDRSADATGDPDAGEWLADLAGYVRYGRACLP